MLIFLNSNLIHSHFITFLQIAKEIVVHSLSHHACGNFSMRIRACIFPKLHILVAKKVVKREVEILHSSLMFSNFCLSNLAVKWAQAGISRDDENESNQPAMYVD